MGAFFYSFFLKYYSFILFIFFTTSILAQKLEKKTIVTTSKTIIIELESINQLKLISTDVIDVIELSYEDFDLTNRPTINDDNDALHIKVIGNPNKIVGSDKTKYRAGQPVFPSYIVKLPKNMTVKAIYDKGNFYTKNFIGSLDLHLNHGVVDILNFKGDVNIRSYSGIINCEISEAKLDVESTKGILETALDDKRLQLTKTDLKGVYKNTLNSLTIKTIASKISLNPVRTQ